MLKIISQCYQWECGDGCCSESKYTLTFYISDFEDGHYVSFYVEEFFYDLPETYQELVIHYSEDSFIGKLIRTASMCGQLIIEQTDDEYVN